MANPRPGEVYWVDLGIAGKFRPLVVVSREDSAAPRALTICVPLTTEIRGGDYEVPVPRVRWLPGAYEGVANIQGLTSIEHHRLMRYAGRFQDQVMAKVRRALGWMLELQQS